MRLDWFRQRPLTALQVEVTSRCTRRCAICPRTALADSWRDGDLADSTWQRLRPDLGLARHVHLQGWGEPLLHPRLAEMARDSLEAGCTVGLTTNADPLPDAVDWLIASGIDHVTVSVAGDDPMHAALRNGSSLAEVWDGVRAVTAARGRAKRPRVQVSFLLTRLNASRLPAVVEAAAAAGADELFVTHLDCTPSQELLDAAAFDAAGLRAGVAVALRDAEAAARELGIEFRAPTLAPQELLVCALSPLRFLFVGWDGRVGPCVNLLLPVEGAIPRHLPAGWTRVQPTVFGDLAEAGMRSILEGDAYRKFVAPFESRLAGERRLVDAVADHRGSGALERLERADRQRMAELAANPFPEACAGCHKVSGW